MDLASTNLHCFFFASILTLRKALFYMLCARQSYALMWTLSFETGMGLRYSHEDIENVP